MARHAFSTALIPCAVQWEEACITRFELAASAAEGDQAPPDWLVPIIAQVQAHLGGGARHDFRGAPLAWHTTSPWQQRVYRLAQQVPPGATRSYLELARGLGEPSRARAVGAALGANPWPLLVPCHRIIAADGRLTGFSAPGGLTLKARLLHREGALWFDA